MTDCKQLQFRSWRKFASTDLLMGAGNLLKIARAHLPIPQEKKKNHQQAVPARNIFQSEYPSDKMHGC